MLSAILRVGPFQTNHHSKVQRCSLSIEACHMCVYPRFSSASLFERNYINNKPNSASCEDDIVGLHEKSFMCCAMRMIAVAWRRKYGKIISLLVWSLFVLCLGVQSRKNSSEWESGRHDWPCSRSRSQQGVVLWSCLCCGCVKTVFVVIWD